jgi:hypothetical protein
MLIDLKISHIMYLLFYQINFDSLKYEGANFIPKKPYSCHVFYNPQSQLSYWK